MQNNTERNRKGLAAAVCAGIMVVFMVATLAVLVLPVLGDRSQDVVLDLVLGIHAVIILAVIAGVLLALKQRLQELRKGEEEDAKKY